ncbi:MAG: hypothetical protein OXG81_16140 [Acidobacteria bacterium]|nr:hypothetical protein [Acidobacteriota bacterium]
MELAADPRPARDRHGRAAFPQRIGPQGAGTTQIRPPMITSSR